MARGVAQPSPLIRLGLALTVVWLLLHGARLDDWLAGVTRPAVVGLLELFGVDSRDAGHELVVGQLRVPWARDCAGSSILTILGILTVWANRTAPLSGRYWLRLALVWPVAFVANVLRILTLIAYRHWFFPMVESPALHYFVGFLWVAPCLYLFFPREGRQSTRSWFETLHLVAVLAWLAPHVPGPGGNVVALATLTLLARNHWGRPATTVASLGTVTWLTAAGFVGLTSMESLWLPWLLACPWFCQWTWRSLTRTGVLLLGAIPLLAMQPPAPWIVVATAAWELWSLVRSPSANLAQRAPASPPLSWRGVVVPLSASLAFVFPFFSSTVSGLLRPSLRPPAGTLWREVAANTYELRILGQSRDIALVCYSPSGDGRHHTLPVCMLYRGITLRPSENAPSVLSDGKFWRKEFFLQDGKLLNSYRDYLRATFWPWTSAGLHLIASAPIHTMSAGAFSQEVERATQQLHRLSR